jgi:hypothetical protein
MKGSHFRLTERMPFYIVHWNAEVIDITAFQSESDTLVSRAALGPEGHGPGPLADDALAACVMTQQMTQPA